MDWLSTFVLFHLPWWVWVPVALIIVAAIVIPLVRLVGLKRALEIAAAVAAALGGLILIQRARQEGWRAREAKGERDAQSAIDKAERARRDAYDQFTARPDRLRDNDGHRRD